MLGLLSYTVGCAFVLGHVCLRIVVGFVETENDQRIERDFLYDIWLSDEYYYTSSS